ncbi:tRNA (adenosine(37)-N6)-threonylcarbamoyltransferase complex dimerization subunit type 1 TsaB [Thalassiella azotivora]
MLLLALDTSSAVSAAVHDGTRLLAGRTVHDPRRHAELLAPAVQDVLAEAGVTRRDLTHVVAGTGPGPFTGLRVALVSARTLGLALGLPVHGVCSLDALARAAVRTGLGGAGGADLVVATDARRKEVYWARYAAVLDDGDVRRLEGPHVGRPADVPVDGAVCVGRGAGLYPEHLGGPPGPAHGPTATDPDAADLAALAAVRLARGVTLDAPEPLYLRRPDAVEPGAPKRVLR